MNNNILKTRSIIIQSISKLKCIAIWQLLIESNKIARTK